MPGKSCSVVTCGNSIYKTKNLEGKTVIYHRFPRDNEIRKQWINCSGREGLWNPDHGCICSDHFTEDDYERDLKAELLNIPNKNRLKPNAIPSQKLPLVKEILSKNLKSGTRIRKRKVQFANMLKLTPKVEIIAGTVRKNTPLILKRRKRPRLQEINNQNIVESTVKEEAPDIDLIDNERDSEVLQSLKDEHKKTVQDMKLKYEYLLKQNENLLLQNSALEKEVKQLGEKKKKQEEIIIKEKEELEKINVALYELITKKVTAIKEQEELEKKNKGLSQQVSSLKYIDTKNKRTISNLQFKMKTAETKEGSCIEKLNQTFSKNQIDLLLKKKTKVLWTAEEITQAFTIRYYSKRCYNYLRDKLNYPLPGLSTLKQWSANPMIKQGILESSFESLVDASENYSVSDKVVVLQYNVIKGTCEQDQINDKIVRPYSRVQVVQAHGLFSNWKQVIYIHYEKLLSTKELFEIIKKLENINFKVIAFIGDCGSRKLWHELEVTVDKSWFSIPGSSDKIFVFADTSHLLKLLRNWFLDTGFTWTDGKTITQEHIDTLLYMNNNGELDTTFKLTSRHVLCKGVQRRIFELATELFSYNTAETIKKYLPDEPQVLETANFIELVSVWFDIFNSDSPNVEGYPLKSAFGSYLKAQTEVLEKFFSEILTMHCGNRDSNMIFQRGILMSINSLLLLQRACQMKYKKKYIFTQKLQLDTLEKLYTQLKSNENQEHNPLDCLERLRLIIMGKLPELKRQQIIRTEQIPNKIKTYINKNKQETVKKEYIFSLIDGQYVLKENIITNDTKKVNKEPVEVNLQDTIDTTTKIENDVSNSAQSDEAEIEVNEDELEEEYFENTIDENTTEDETTFTLAIDPAVNGDEINEEYISTILQSAGINISAMPPGQIVEVVIEDANEIDYDESDIIHEVQIVDEIH